MVRLLLLSLLAATRGAVIGIDFGGRFLKVSRRHTLAHGGRASAAASAAWVLRKFSATGPQRSMAAARRLNIMAPVRPVAAVRSPGQRVRAATQGRRRSVAERVCMRVRAVPMHTCCGAGCT